uniref:Pre-mRNA-processing factor 19 n=1 Tax=Babesia bovis TaxID=5865 RepID=S6C7S2_BABBO|nr:WD domain, G-beta repeat containing protein [Babesia bovis]
MSLICSISGVQPEEPCISKTGYVFERKLIEKHLQESQTCPATGKPLTVDDLIPIQCDKTVIPRPATAMSIPGLLSLMQSEWDALALETYNLRKHTNTVRKQLCQSLYEHDAATRVIARLIKERDAALQQVESLEKLLLEFRTNYNAGAIEVGLDDSSVSRIEDLAKALMAERKKRDVARYSTTESIAKYTLKGDYRAHSSTSPGILSVTLDYNAARGGHNLCFTGGADGAVVYFDLDAGRTVTRMTSHLKPVNTVVSHPYANVVISGSDDKTVRVWKGPENADASDFKCSHVLKSSKAPVVSMSLHPSTEYFLAGASDGLWHLVDLESGQIIKICRDIPSPCSKVQFHPDGLLAAGSGTDGAVHIWDIRTQSLASTLKHDTATSPLSSLSFSENGYHLATVSQEGHLRLWDLRKSVVFANADCNMSPTAVSFDGSGSTIAVASTKVELYRLFDKTQVELMGTLEGHSGYLTDLEFGPDSKFVLTTAKDKSLRLFS